MEFDLPKDTSSIIKVIGVGGGGSNAVNHMYGLGIVGVDFIVCNTDRQALDISPVPYKIQLGPSLTEGRGAGAIPEIGKNAAIENIDEIRDLLGKGTKMVFVTAGMGGGTGTGAAPVIAQVARELGILTVGIVTVPFDFEGRKRRQQAEHGLDRLREQVDTLLVINNERLREITGNLSISSAFSMADDVLSTAAKGIAEVISVTGAINVDFNDVNTVMRNSGVAIMGSAAADGEDRALAAVKQALSSPLLNDNDISGAQYVLLNITYGDKEVLMDEITTITDYIQDEAGSTADVIWGHGFDPTLGDKLSVTLIATGFKGGSNPVVGIEKAPEK
ncbi:MAG: cell division protein FtsZ, partial [Bacteroidota bacterium]